MAKRQSRIGIGDQLCKFCGEMLHNLFDNIILVLFQYIINMIIDHTCCISNVVL